MTTENDIDDANTCLETLKVMSRLQSHDESLAKKCQTDADAIYKDVLEERQESYQRESSKCGEHKHVNDARANMGGRSISGMAYVGGIRHLSMIRGKHSKKVIEAYTHINKLDMNDMDLQDVCL